jgi:hypothetical protein
LPNIADAADRLRDQQRGRAGVHERGDVRASSVHAPDADGDAERDPAPDAEAALPDRERAPPGVRDLVPARDHVIEAAADQAGGEAPQRDLVDQLGVASGRDPAAPGDVHRGDDGDRVEESIDVQGEPDVDDVVRGAGNRRDHGGRG